MSKYFDAVLLIAHGSSDLSADSTCSDLLYNGLRTHFPGTPIYQAYSAPITLRKIDRSSAKTPVQTIDEAVEQVLSDGIRRLFVLALSLNPCKKYSKVLQTLEPHRSRFEMLSVSTPLLNAQDDPSELSAALAEIIRQAVSEASGRTYEQVLLAAHTANEEILSLWAPVLEKLKSDCPLPVSLLYRNGHPNVEDYLACGPHSGTTLVIPLMLFGGRHLRKDLAGDENSLRSKLEQAGIPVALSEKGLGEYPQIRDLYYKKLDS